MLIKNVYLFILISFVNQAVATSELIEDITPDRSQKWVYLNSSNNEQCFLEYYLSPSHNECAFQGFNLSREEAINNVKIRISSHNPSQTAIDLLKKSIDFETFRKKQTIFNMTRIELNNESLMTYLDYYQNSTDLIECPQNFDSLGEIITDDPAYSLLQVISYVQRKNLIVFFRGDERSLYAIHKFDCKAKDTLYLLLDKAHYNLLLPEDSPNEVHECAEEREILTLKDLQEDLFGVQNEKPSDLLLGFMDIDKKEDKSGDSVVPEYRKMSILPQAQRQEKLNFYQSASDLAKLLLNSLPAFLPLRDILNLTVVNSHFKKVHPIQHLLKEYGKGLELYSVEDIFQLKEIFSGAECDFLISIAFNLNPSMVNPLLFYANFNTRLANMTDSDNGFLWAPMGSTETSDSEKIIDILNSQAKSISLDNTYNLIDLSFIDNHGNRKEIFFYDNNLADKDFDSLQALRLGLEENITTLSADDSFLLLLMKKNALGREADFDSVKESLLSVRNITNIQVNNDFLYYTHLISTNKMGNGNVFNMFKKFIKSETTSSKVKAEAAFNLILMQLHHSFRLGITHTLGKGVFNTLGVAMKYRHNPFLTKTEKAIITLFIAESLRFTYSLSQDIYDLGTELEIIKNSSLFNASLNDWAQILLSLMRYKEELVENHADLSDEFLELARSPYLSTSQRVLCKNHNELIKFCWFDAFDIGLGEHPFQ